MIEDSHQLRLKDSRAYKGNPEKHFSGVSSLTEHLCSALSQTYLPGSHSLTHLERTSFTFPLFTIHGLSSCSNLKILSSLVM